MQRYTLKQGKLREDLKGDWVRFEVADLLLEIERRMRQYIAFVLTDDENADAQLAADRVAAELRRLRAERERLPRFADGVIAYPGNAAWFPGEREPGTVGSTGRVCGNLDWGADTEECYSMREAAEKAR